MTEATNAITQDNIHFTILTAMTETAFKSYNNAFNREAASLLPVVDVGEANVKFDHEMIDRRQSVVTVEVTLENNKTWTIRQSFNYGVPGGTIVNFHPLEYDLFKETDLLLGDLEEVNGVFAEAIAFVCTHYDVTGKPRKNTEL